MAGGHTEFEKARDDRGEAGREVRKCTRTEYANLLFKEEFFAVSVSLGIFLEALVCDEYIVGASKQFQTQIREQENDLRKHHKGLGLLVLKLLRTVPLFPLPSELSLAQVNSSEKSQTFLRTRACSSH